MSTLLVCIIISQHLSMPYSGACDLNHLRKNNSFSRNILHSQIPDTLNGINMACQLDSLYPFDFEAVDDIVVTGEGWDIDTIITWWWNWHGFSTWELVPNIHFLVYPDSGLTYGPKDSSCVDIAVEQANYEVYEYVTGERWRVEMALPSVWPTVLSPGRWWIEIQPSNAFSDNGQTGIVAEVGCGNGFEAWCRYPTISHYYWGPATYWFGAPYEMGFLLIGKQIIGVQEHGGDNTPVGFGFVNYPQNPASGCISIVYNTIQSEHVSLIVYSASGHVAEILVDTGQSGGRHSVAWNTRHLPNGIYFLRLKTAYNVDTRKIVVIR